jgi:hypothetical protein
LQSGKPYVKHQLSPRIVLEAIDEIRGRNLGFYSNESELELWEKTFDKERNLPVRKDVYSPKPIQFNILRTLTFIKTERERKMVIGEDYKQEPIPLGHCYVEKGWAYNGEIEIFKFRYDYFTLAK